MADSSSDFSSSSSCLTSNGELGEVADGVRPEAKLAASIDDSAPAWREVRGQAVEGLLLHDQRQACRAHRVHHLANRRRRSFGAKKRNKKEQKQAFKGRKKKGS